MKYRFFLAFTVIMALVLLVSCLSTEQYMVNNLTKQPDGVNDNMLYGYIDMTQFGNIQKGTLVKALLLPIEYELVVHTRAGNFSGSTRLEPELRRYEEYKLRKSLTGIISNKVFSIENIDPGEYYLAAIFIEWSTGDTKYTHTIRMPWPEMGSGIQIEADRMIYWGARTLDANNVLEVSDAVSRKEVAAILAETIPHRGWDDRIASEL